MQDLPHHYVVSADAKSVGNIVLSSSGVENLLSAAPAEFGGPGDQWSPEALLVASVADCFILSFRAVAKASKLDWDALTCSAEGVLERVERTTQFTRFNVAVTLDVPPGTDESKAHRLLEKAEQVCLITNSLKAERHLETAVRFSAD